MTFFFLPGEYHKILFLCLGLFALFLYVQVRLRFLRFESDTYFGSDNLHRAESCWWSLPLGILAGAWERRTHKARDPSVYLPMYVGWHWFLMHVFGHLAFLKYVLPTFEPKLPANPYTYQMTMSHEKAGLAIYLNTNPIEVLKSHQESCGNGLVFYRKDKQYLQDRAVKAFDGEEYYAETAQSMCKLLFSSGSGVVKETGVELLAMTPSLSGTIASEGSETDSLALCA